MSVSFCEIKPLKVCKWWFKFKGESREILRQREIKCLRILNKYTVKYPCPNGSHFPKLISEGTKGKDRYICMSNQGVDLKNLKNVNYNICIKNVDQQLKYIYNTLKKCQISHLDLGNAPKNICVNNSGIISLVDFGAIFFRKMDTWNNKIEMYKLETLYPNFSHKSFIRMERSLCKHYKYEIFYKMMIKMIQSCKNITIK